jgi:hypothetical protein
MLKLIPQIKKIGLYGSTFFPDVFESYDIEQTNNRFVAIPKCEPGFKVNNLLELA